MHRASWLSVVPLGTGTLIQRSLPKSAGGGLDLNQRPLGYEPFPIRHHSPRAANNALGVAPVWWRMNGGRAVSWGIRNFEGTLFDSMYHISLPAPA